MPVGDLGPEEVTTVQPEATVEDIVETLESENVGSVVVQEDRKPVGIVTDRDIALQVTKTDDVTSVSAEEVMAEDPVTIQEDEEAIELSHVIGENNVRRIPVVDEDGNLTGIVTLDDLVATIGEQLESVADTIEVQSPDYSP